MAKVSNHSVCSSYMDRTFYRSVEQNEVTDGRRKKRRWRKMTRKRKMNGRKGKGEGGERKVRRPNFRR